MSDWVEEETKSADFGDRRLKRRFNKILEALYEHSCHSIPAACGGWSDTLAAYRFFDHQDVRLEDILASHRQATLERIAACPVVLSIQDTTHLIREKGRGNKGLGTIKVTEKTDSLLHVNAAFTPSRICLGVLGVQHWQRTQKMDKRQQRTAPIESKESYRWLEGYQQACEVQGLFPDHLIVSVADRESDIYELFVDAHNYQPPTRAGWIVRAAQNRRVEDEHHKVLRSYLQASPVLGMAEFTLPAQGKRPARLVRQTVQSAAVPLSALRRKGHTLPSTLIHAVLVKEQHPPEGEAPIEWLLLTNLEVDRFEQAQTIVQWYVCRWEIEIYFRILKNGCQVQKLQLETTKRFEACLGVYLIVAWRIQLMTMLGRQCPDTPCSVVLDKEEWEALWVTVNKTKPPSKAPPLKEAIQMIAQLGGYLARKHDPPPGTKTIWIGLQRLRDFTLAIRSFKISAD